MNYNVQQTVCGFACKTHSSCIFCSSPFPVSFECLPLWLLHACLSGSFTPASLLILYTIPFALSNQEFLQVLIALQTLSSKLDGRLFSVGAGILCLFTLHLQSLLSLPLKVARHLQQLHYQLTDCQRILKLCLSLENILS